MRVHDLRAISSAFEVPGSFLWAIPYGNGHINDTYLTALSDAGRETRYIFQHINGRVFADPVGIVRNIAIVTRHIEGKLVAAAAADLDRRVLRLINTREGGPCIKASDGEIWRGYRYVENTRSFDSVDKPDQARAAARAFGEFQMLLADLDASLLTESIPRFHDTPWRLQNLRDAAAADRVGRLASVKGEVEAYLRHEPLCRRLADAHAAGKIPLRVTHNDCKLNNILFDAVRDEAICVIDLDTVMPGLSLHDFGDMVRTGTSTAREDAEGGIQVSMELFGALLEGYLSQVGSILTPTEWEELHRCGMIITLEIGMRFLTDHLDGDRYFKVAHAEHNLIRSRNQMARVHSMLEQEAQMKSLVEAARLRFSPEKTI